MIVSMAVFGSIGLFVRYVPFPSIVIAAFRGLSGAAFIYIFMALGGKRPVLKDRGKTLFLLALSGCAIGVNWILLFESYRYTTVARATLCYYMQPVIVMLLSPVLASERLTARKLISVIISFLGMILVTGAAGGTIGGTGELRGIALGLGAACFYSTVIFLNRLLRDTDDMTTTFYQLLFAGLSVLPLALTQELPLPAASPAQWAALAAVGILHTGAAYTAYFSAMHELDTQTTAMLGYIDPVCALFFSWMLLGESPDAGTVTGAVMILGGTLLGSIEKRKETDHGQN